MKWGPSRIIVDVEEDPSQFEILPFPWHLPCLLTLFSLLNGI
jgi:hypothetical protein